MSKLYRVWVAIEVEDTDTEEFSDLDGIDEYCVFYAGTNLDTAKAYVRKIWEDNNELQDL